MQDAQHLLEIHLQVCSCSLSHIEAEVVSTASKDSSPSSAGRHSWQLSNLEQELRTIQGVSIEAQEAFNGQKPGQDGQLCAWIHLSALCSAMNASLKFAGSR